MGAVTIPTSSSPHPSRKILEVFTFFKMLWLLGLLAVGQTGADYWWMGTKAFGGGNLPNNGLVEVQPGFGAGANEAASNSRLIKDQQEREVATNPFLGAAQEPVQESICPEGQSCQASCPQTKKKIRGYGGIQERIVQHLPCDNGVCCPTQLIPPKSPVLPVSSQDSVAPESSKVNSISSLPITECPATMKCVREDFCDANGVMVPYRVSLTDQEKRKRGTLIPCMQLSGSLAVCCTAPQEQQETRGSSNKPALQQQLTLEPEQPVEAEVALAEQQLQQQQLSPTDSCPVLNTLPPLAECQGRTSNCWSPGVRDLDCLDSALCCFDGCANVCQGKGAAAGNGLVPEKKGPARLPVLASSPLLEPLIKSPTKADLQTVAKVQKQNQLEPQITTRPDVQSQIQPQTTVQFNPQIPNNSQAELDAALGELAKVLVAESRPRPSPIDDRIVYPEPLANNRYPRRPVPVANPSPSYEELLVVADQKAAQKAAQKNAQRPNYAGQPLIQKPEATQITSGTATHGFGYGGQATIRQPATQFKESKDSGPKPFVEAIQPPNPRNSPKLQSQYQTAQQPTYEPQTQTNDFTPAGQVESQPSRSGPSVKAAVPVQSSVEAAAPVPSDQGAAALPFTQCPSAMKCVEKKLCDFNGVMRNFVTALSPAQESLRVPLIPCVSQRAGGEVDVCCRDPNYKDPWPEQEQAREESRALGEGDQWRWSKDARSGANAARARSKVASNPQQGRAVASNPQQPRVVENQAPASFAPSQLPTRVEGDQPSIFEESVKEVSSSPRSEEVKKPKRRIAYA